MTHSDRYDPTTRRVAAVVGLLFLFATATFLAGDALIAGYFAAADGSTAALGAGVALQALCAVAAAAMGLALLPVLRRHSPGAAAGYAALRCAEAVVIVAIGSYTFATRSFVDGYELMIYGFTGAAGLLFSYVLYTAGLAPRWLAALGLVGYAAILLAVPAGVFGVASLDSGPGMLLYVPGGLFELVLPVLLVAKGFRRAAAATPAGGRAPTVTA